MASEIWALGWEPDKPDVLILLFQWPHFSLAILTISNHHSFSEQTRI